MDHDLAQAISRFVASIPKISYYRPGKVDMSACWLYFHQRPLELADVLDKLLQLTGWTKVELARRMGTTTQTVSKILNGQQKGLTPENKRNLEAACVPYPELYDRVCGMAVRGPGRPPVIERI